MNLIVEYTVSHSHLGDRVEAMDQQSSPLQRLGRYSGIAVVLSVVACYGTLALVAVLSLAGVTMSVHEGAWAAVIVAALWDRQLRRRGPAPLSSSDQGS